MWNPFYLYPQYRRFRNQLSTVVEVVRIEFATQQWEPGKMSGVSPAAPLVGLSVNFGTAFQIFKKDTRFRASNVLRIMLSKGEAQCSRKLRRQGRAKLEGHLPEEME